MTETEHLLTCLAEECCEVAKHCHKALRFGLDDTDPTIAGAATEQYLINAELTDLLGVVEMLVAVGVLPQRIDREGVNLKKIKVRKFMEYARNRGVLK